MQTSILLNTYYNDSINIDWPKNVFTISYSFIYQISPIDDGEEIYAKEKKKLAKSWDRSVLNL